LGYDWDPDWILTDRQRELRDLLIELCQTEMRANAKTSDDKLEFPRRNLELLDLLGEILPDMRKGFAEGRPAHIPDAPTHASLVAAAGGPTDSTVYAAADDVTGRRAEEVRS
jgi:hypothetical protein